MVTWAWLSGLLVLAVVAGGGDTPSPRQPVLVELFTSEGCSSCPPADALLERLDRTQPVEGVQIIVLSEHVDYWNHIGWADPFSSPAFSKRQETYARRFRISGPYTPQMIVDGQAEFVGSDSHMAESSIRAASREPKLAVRIAPPPPGGTEATVEVDSLPAGTARVANVFVARASNSGSLDVSRGENRGRRLHHVAIVSELLQVGKVDTQSGFKSRLPLRGDNRLIVFVQDPVSEKVLGAAMYLNPHL